MVRGGRGGGYCYCQLQIYVYSSRIYYLLYLFSITHLHGDQGHLRSSRGERGLRRKKRARVRERAREGERARREKVSSKAPRFPLVPYARLFPYAHYTPLHNRGRSRTQLHPRVLPCLHCRSERGEP